MGAELSPQDRDHSHLTTTGEEEKRLQATHEHLSFQSRHAHLTSQDHLISQDHHPTSSDDGHFPGPHFPVPSSDRGGGLAQRFVVLGNAVPDPPLPTPTTTPSTHPLSLHPHARAHVCRYA